MFYAFPHSFYMRTIAACQELYLAGIEDVADKALCGMLLFNWIWCFAKLRCSRFRQNLTVLNDCIEAMWNMFHTLSRQ